MELEQPHSSTGASGVYSNESFKILFDYEVARAQRYPSPLTIVHIAVETVDPGEEVKAQANQVLSDILNRSLRLSDIPTQFGQEFLILLPATDLNGGRALAERILSALRSKQDFPTDKLFQMDLYIGLASRYVENYAASQELLAEASVAMNDARVKKSRSYVTFSDISKDIPKPSNTK